MSYLGHIEKGKVVFDAPVPLPDGTNMGRLMPWTKPLAFRVRFRSMSWPNGKASPDRLHHLMSCWEAGLSTSWTMGLKPHCINGVSGSRTTEHGIKCSSIPTWPAICSRTVLWPVRSVRCCNEAPRAGVRIGRRVVPLVDQEQVGPRKDRATRARFAVTSSSLTSAILLGLRHEWCGL